MNTAHPRIKRLAAYAARGLCFVTIGAAVAWLVAFVLAVYGDRRGGLSKPLQVEGWYHARWRGPGVDINHFAFLHQYSPRVPFTISASDQSAPRWLARLPLPERARKGSYVTGAGWPCIAFWSVEVFYLAGDRMRSDVLHGFKMTPKWGPVRGFEQTVPLRPMWPGFWVNTAIYAGVAFLGASAFRLPLVVIRRRRRKRGLCVRCGYPLGTGAKCPECGRLVG